MTRYSADDVRKMLARECKAAGGQHAWAARHKVTPQYVCDVLKHRREPGESITIALGLRRVTYYELT